MVTDCMQLRLEVAKGWSGCLLHCFGNEVVDLSMMIGSSQIRRMDSISRLSPRSQGVQLPDRSECVFFNQNKTIKVNRA